MNPIQSNQIQNFSLNPFKIDPKKTEFETIMLCEVDEECDYSEYALGGTRAPPAFTCPKAEEVISALKEWKKSYLGHAYIGKNDHSEIIQIEAYFQWLTLLPLPTDSYWDALSNSQLGEYVDLLCNIIKGIETNFLIQHHLPMEKKRLSALRIYFMVMMAFSASHQLMVRLHPKEFDGWCVSWDPTFINKVFAGEVFFIRGEHQAKLIALTRHVKELTQNPRKGFIFGFNHEENSISLNPELFSRDWNSLPEEKIQSLSLIEQHFKFLSQFIPSKEPISFEAFSKVELSLISSDVRSEDNLKPSQRFGLIASQLARLSSMRSVLGMWNSNPPSIHKEHNGQFSYRPVELSWLPPTSIDLKQSPLNVKQQFHPFYVYLFNNLTYESENKHLSSNLEVNPSYSLNASEKVLHQLAALAAPYNKENRVALILNWMQKNGASLRDKTIQRYLFQLLLAEEHILKAPAYVINSLRLFIQKVIKELRGTSAKDQPHALFWVYLGYLIESRLHIENRAEEKFISFYQKVTKRLIENSQLEDLAIAEAKSLLILLHAHLPNISETQMEDFTCYLLQVNDLFSREALIGEKEWLRRVDLLRLEAGGVMLQWKDAHTAHFNKLGNLLKWLAERKVPGFSFHATSYKNSYPVLRLKSRSLDLVFGRYPTEEKKMPWEQTFGNPIPREKMRLPNYKLFVPPSLDLARKALNLMPDETVEFDVANGQLYTLDGSGRCFQGSEFPNQPLHRLNKDLLTKEEREELETKLAKASDYLRKEPTVAIATKKFSYKGFRGIYRYVERSVLKTTKFPESLYKKQTFWVSTEKGSQRHIIILDKQRIPYAKIAPIEGNKEGKLECIKLNQEGEESEERLVHFESLSQDAQNKLYEYFDNPDQECLIWVKPQGESCIITHLDHPSLGVTFEPKVTDKETRFYSKQFPGYYLLANRENKNHFLSRDALLYEKSGGERFALIPFRSALSKSYRTSPRSPTIQNSYFTVHWHKRRKTFCLSSQKEDLFLISSLLLDQQFEQAYQLLHALQPLRHYDETDYEIFQEFLEAKDPTACLCLISLQLALHFLDNQQQFFVRGHAHEPINQSKLLNVIERCLSVLNSNPQLLPKELVLGLTAHHRELLHHFKFSSEGLPEAIEAPNTLLGKAKLEPPKIADWFQFPIETVAKKCYEKISNPVNLEEFALDKPADYGKNPLATSFYNQLAKGHAENQKKATTRFRLKIETESVKTELENSLEQDKQKVQELTETIDQLANENNSGAPLHVHDPIYLSFLYRDSNLLTAANPKLSEEQIIKIWNMTLELMLVQSRVDQTWEALQKLKTKNPPPDLHQEVAKILYKERLYLPHQVPECLSYEYATGKFLRAEQAQLLQWIATHENQAQLQIEFPAGGGKTKIISPILCFIAIQNGLLPVFFSLPAMHNVIKQDLSSTLRDVFDIKIHNLEIDLETDLTENDLENILSSLKRWHTEKATLVVKPITFHALHMQLFHHLNNPNSVAQEILDFLDKHALFIIDEAHRNLISTWRAIVASKEIPCLNADEQNLFIQIYRLLVGITALYVEPGVTLSNYVNLILDKQSELTNAQRKKVFRIIATWLCQHYFKIEEQKQEELINYLCHTKAPSPQLPPEWDGTQKELFFLARGLLTKILKITLKMMHQFDYGPPQAPYDVAMPRHAKMLTGAQFADPDLAAALSCQNLYQSGLDLRQFKEMVALLKKRHFLSHVNQHTQENYLFQQWQKSAGLSCVFSIDQVEHEEDIISLHEKLKQQFEVVEYYLAHHLLAKVKRYTHQLNSTAADLNDGCYKSILLSATLGMEAEYPVGDFDLDQQKVRRAHLSDFPFQADAIQQACRPHNSTMVWLNLARTPKEFFQQVHALIPVVFQTIEGVIDAGGMLRHSSTEEIALAFLEFNQEKELGFQGVVFIREQIQPGQSAFQLIFMERDKKLFIPVHGSDFLAALRNHGVKDPEQCKILRVFDSSQAVGTDAFFTRQAKVLLTMGPESTLSIGIQAMLRCRGFLEPPSETGVTGQSVVWVGTQSFKEKIAHKYGIGLSSVSPKNIMQWCFEREYKAAEPRILLQACQSIARVIRSAMEQALNTRHAWVQEHRNGIFFDEISRDLASTYASAYTVKPIKEVLEEYRDTLLAKADLQLTDIPGTEKKIEAIIEEASTVIKEIKTQALSDSTSTVQAQQQQQQHVQQSQQQQQMQQSQVFHNSFPPAPFINYAEKTRACSSHKLLSPPDQETLFSANALFSSPAHPLFYKHLYLLGNVVKTNQEREISVKPIDFFLLILTEEEGIEYPRFYCASQEDARLYAQQLAGGNSLQGCQIALCTSLGELAQNGTSSGISNNEWEELRTTPLWKELLVHIALLNGEILDGPFFQQELIRWREAGISEKELKTTLKLLCKKQYLPENAHFFLSFLERLPPLKQAANYDPTSFVAENLSLDDSNEEDILDDSNNEDINVEVQNEPQPPKGEPQQVVPAPSLRFTKATIIRSGIIALAILALIGFGTVGSLSLVGKYMVHAPQYAINLYKLLPAGFSYVALTISGVDAIALITYLLYHYALKLNHKKFKTARAG